MTRLLLNATGDGGGATDLPADATLARLLKRHGGGEALSGLLLQQVQHLQAENARLKGQVPAEGSVVLSGDDAATWNELKVLGKPADLKAAIAERDTLRGQVARHARDKALGTHGYDADALGPLLPPDAAIEESEARGADGKATKSLAIRLAGADRPTPLAEYIDANLAKFRPVIGGPGSQTQERAAGPRGAPPTPTTRREAPAPGQGDRPADPAAEVRAQLARERSYAF